MKFSQLKGLAVVDLQDARKLGDLEDLLLDPLNRQVMELKVKTGLFGSHLCIPLQWMKKIGRDALTVAYDSNSTALPGGDGSPAHNQAGQTAGTTVAETPKLVGLSQILANQVVTDGGTLLGEIKDVLLNEADLRVEGYEVSMGSLFSKTQTFPATQDIRYGARLVTLPEELLNSPGK